MNSLIAIKPVKVLEFPEVKYAHYLTISDVRVKVIDQGATIFYNLLDEEYRMVFQNGIIELNNEELSGWTNSDMQLVNILLSKLNLEIQTEN